MSWNDAKQIAEKIFAEWQAARRAPGEIEVLIVAIEMELNKETSTGPRADGNLPEVLKLYGELKQEFGVGMIRIIIRALERELKRLLKANRGNAGKL